MLKCQCRYLFCLAAGAVDNFRYSNPAKIFVVVLVAKENCNRDVDVLGCEGDDEVSCTTILDYMQQDSRTKQLTSYEDCDPKNQYSRTSL
jgi:hypothetical protein